MKSILITGSNGFIGSALKDTLKKQKYKIFEFNSSDGDISTYNFLEKYQNIKLEYIFHLASKTYVPLSWEKPIDFYKTSVLGTANILELCRVKNIPLTFISSYLYGDVQEQPIPEHCEVQANNPYAHSKYLAEELCKFYSEHYGVKVAVIRPFNVYGKNQKNNFLIPYIIDQVLHKKSIRVKTLEPARDYIYLEDLISGLIKTLELQKKFAIYNLGSGKELSVQEVIDSIQKIAGTKKKIISEAMTRKNEIMHTIADISKAKAELAWEPLFSFEDGIRDIFGQKI